jgi:hypothetical protein
MREAHITYAEAMYEPRAARPSVPVVGPVPVPPYLGIKSVATAACSLMSESPDEFRSCRIRVMMRRTGRRADTPGGVARADGSGAGGVKYAV